MGIESQLVADAVNINIIGICSQCNILQTKVQCCHERIDVLADKHILKGISQLIRYDSHKLIELFLLSLFAEIQINKYLDLRDFFIDLMDLSFSFLVGQIFWSSEDNFNAGKLFDCSGNDIPGDVAEVSDLSVIFQGISVGVEHTYDSDFCLTVDASDSIHNILDLCRRIGNGICHFVFYTGKVFHCRNNIFFCNLILVLLKHGIGDIEGLLTVRSDQDHIECRFQNAKDRVFLGIEIVQESQQNIIAAELNSYKISFGQITCHYAVIIVKNFLTVQPRH